MYQNGSWRLQAQELRVNKSHPLLCDFRFEGVGFLLRCELEFTLAHQFCRHP